MSRAWPSVDRGGRFGTERGHVFVPSSAAGRLCWVRVSLCSSSGRPGHRSCPRRAGASPGPSRWRCPEAARTCVASGDVVYAGL